MAEGWGQHLAGDRIIFESAGVAGYGTVMAEAVEVMAEVGIDISGRMATPMEEVDWENIDLAVFLLDNPPLPPSTFTGALLHRPVGDPFGRDLDTFRRVRDEISRLIRDVIAGLE